VYLGSQSRTMVDFFGLFAIANYTRTRAEMQMVDAGFPTGYNLA